MSSKKNYKSNRVIKIIVIVLLIIVAIFAIINLFTNNYIRDVIIKGQKPQIYK
ncbi:MAG: hypothetical protein Q4E33_05735 [Erysipelotrichaceae bacterium]|nr:hypothetical protein [Erysipelotrichaceae bacterium]